MCLKALSLSKYRQYPNRKWNFPKSYFVCWFWELYKNNTHIGYISKSNYTRVIQPNGCEVN